MIDDQEFHSGDQLMNLFRCANSNIRIEPKIHPACPCSAMANDGIQPMVQAKNETIFSYIRKKIIWIHETVSI